MNSDQLANHTRKAGFYVTKENITLGVLITLVLAVFGGGWRMGQLVTTVESQGATLSTMAGKVEAMQNQMFSLTMDLQTVRGEAKSRADIAAAVAQERYNDGRIQRLPNTPRTP